MKVSVQQKRKLDLADFHSRIPNAICILVYYQPYPTTNASYHCVIGSKSIVSSWLEEMFNCTAPMVELAEH